MNLSVSSRLPVSWLLIGSACLLLLTGCGEKLVIVKGTVLQNDKPLEVSNTGSVLVTLVPDVPEGTPYTTYPCRADPATGAFETAEPVKPGKYRIAVEQNDPLPGDDKLKGKFAPRISPIRREIVDEKTHLTIDLANEGAP